MYEDAGKLLSAYASVESAELPADMEKLCDAIVKFGNVQEFTNLKTTKDFSEYMKSEENLSTALEKFFVKHGHRSISEVLDILFVYFDFC